MIKLKEHIFSTSNKEVYGDISHIINQLPVNYDEQSLKFEEIADNYYKSEWFTEAEKYYREALNYSTSVDIHYKLARSLEQQGKHQEAVLIYQNIIQLDNSQIDISYKKIAEIYYSENNYEAAGSYYKSLLEQNSESTELLTKVAECLFETKEYEASFALYSRVIEENRKNQEVRARLLFLSYQLNDKEDLFIHLSEGMSYYPLEFIPYLDKLFSNKSASTKETLFNIVNYSDMFYSYPSFYYFSKGMIEYYYQDTIEAAKYFLLSLKKQPDYDTPSFWLFNTAINLYINQPDAAEALLDKWTEVAPKNDFLKLINTIIDSRLNHINLYKIAKKYVDIYNEQISNSLNGAELTAQQIKKIIGNTHSKVSILDIGCYTDRPSQYIDNASFKACADISFNNLEKLQNLGIYDSLFNLDSTSDVTPQHKFDIIIISGISSFFKSIDILLSKISIYTHENTQIYIINDFQNAERELKETGAIKLCLYSHNNNDFIKIAQNYNLRPNKNTVFSTNWTNNCPSTAKIIALLPNNCKKSSSQITA